MDDNNLHNDFDDRDIRTDDKYDELGFRKTSNNESFSSNYLLGVSVIIVFIIAYVCISLFNNISNNNKIKKQIEEKQDKVSECIKIAEKHVEAKYELNLTASKGYYENNKCIVSFDYYHNGIVEFNYDNKERIYDNFESERINEELNNVIKEELSKDYLIKKSFYYFGLGSDNLYDTAFIDNNFSKVLHSYEIFIYVFDNPEKTKVDQFLLKYKFRSIKIIYIDKTNINDDYNRIYDNTISNVRYVNKAIRYQYDNIVNYNYKNLVITKDDIKELTKIDYDSDVNITLEVNDLCDINKVSIDKTSSNCYKVNFNNCNSSDIKSSYVYFHSNSYDRINIKFDDDLIPVMNGNYSLNTKLLSKLEYDICIKK